MLGPTNKRKILSDYWIPIFFLISVFAVGVHGLGMGLDVSGDSRAIIETSIPAILRGSYIAARSFGNPLYEFIAAILYKSGGIFFCSLYSLILAFASILLFNQLLVREVSDVRRFFALGALCLNPLFLVNAFSVTEWMQMCFVLLCLLTFARNWTVRSTPSNLIGLGISCATLVLTRPDSTTLCGSLLFTLLWQSRFRLRTSASVLCAFITAGVVTAAIFGILNHGYAFLKTGVVSSSFHVSYLRRIIVATVHLYSVFGIVGILILASLVGAAYWRLLLRRHDLSLSFWMRLLIIAGPVGALQYVVLPDKLEYILYLLIIAILAIVHEQSRTIWLALFAFSTTASSLVVLSFFERSYGSDQLFFRPRLGPSAVQQDLATITYNWHVTNDPLFLPKIAQAVYGTADNNQPHLRSERWGVGLLSDSNDLIIGEENLHQLDNPRYGPEYRRSKYTHIYLCDKSVYAIGGSGWRLAEPARQWPTIDDRTGNLDLHCHQEAPKSGP